MATNTPWREKLRDQQKHSTNHTLGKPPRVVPKSEASEPGSFARQTYKNPPLTTSSPRQRAVGGANFYVGTGIGFVHNKLQEGINHLENLTGLSNLTTSPLNKLWRVFIKANLQHLSKPKQTDLEQLMVNSMGATLNKKVARRGSQSLANARSRLESLKYSLLSETQIVEAYQANKKDYTGKLVKTNPYQNDVYLMASMGQKVVSLKLQTRPHTLAVDSTPSWVSVRSMGRNHPFMVYTGGEESLTFDLSWYANDENGRDDVISKCRLLEAWSKADGYNASPPLISILWGTSDIFQNYLFVLASASYELTNFQDCNLTTSHNSTYDGYDYRVVAGAKKPITEADRNPRTYNNLGLYPTVAKQKLVLKRVTSSNLTYAEMVDMTALSKLKDSITIK